MDDLDLTEQVPRDFETGPVATMDPVDAGWTPVLVEPVAPLSATRAALGTKTGIAVLPRRTITLPPPIPTAALRAKGSEGGIDVDFSGDEPATTTFVPDAAGAREPDPAWLARFHPPKLDDAAFLFDKAPPRESTVHVDGSIANVAHPPGHASAATEFWTTSPRAADLPVAATADEPPPWESDRAPSEPLSWTAPVVKQSLEVPASSSPIAAIVAAAEAETAAAIAATMKQFPPITPTATPAMPVAAEASPVVAAEAPAPEAPAAVEAAVVKRPVTAGLADIGFENEDGTTADPWAATDAASAAGLQVPRAQPRAFSSTVSLPPPMPSRNSRSTSQPFSAAGIAISRVPTPNVLVDDSQAAALPKPAPSTNWMRAGTASRPSSQIAAATEPREPTLPPLPVPAKNWQRAASPSAAALAPTALGRPHSSADITASLDDDDDALLAATGRRSTLKISALIAAGGVVMAALVYAMVRLATPTPAAVPAAEPAPMAAAPAAVAAPAPVAVPVPVPVPVAVAVAAPVAPPVAVAAPVAPPAPAIAATAPIAAPAATGVGPLPTLIAMPIITTPAGVTVTLVANGQASILGATPLTASLDPSKSYDLVLAAPGQPTRMQHVAPGTREVRIDMSAPTASNHAIAETAPATPRHTAPPAAPAVAAPAAKPAPTAKPAIATTPTAKPVIATTPTAKPAIATTPTAKPTTAPTTKSVPAPAPTPAKPAAVAAATPSGSGVLMVSSKPPCDIVIDGKPTHLMTPQRKLTLSAGPHTITLLNAAQHISSVTKVEILVGLPSRVIKDFTTH